MSVVLTNHAVGVLIVLQVIILLFLLAIWWRITGQKRFSEGDYVLCKASHSPELMNAITIVLSDNGSSVTVRGQGTTTTLHKKWFTLIDFAPDYPIRVPEQPVDSGHTSERSPYVYNGAKFKEIPRSWFDYRIDRYSPILLVKKQEMS